MSRLNETIDNLISWTLIFQYADERFSEAILTVKEIQKKTGNYLFDVDEKQVRLIRMIEACSYSRSADRLFDKNYSWNDVENVEALNTLNYAKKLLSDFGNQYGWDDETAMEMMRVQERIGSRVSARNYAIFVLDSEEDSFRQPAIDVYNKITEEIVLGKKFIDNVDFDDRKYVFIGRNRQQIAGTYQLNDNKRIVNWIFTIDQLPIDMFFPLGRPQTGLYMAHPVKTDRYYPMKGAEEILFMEKVREFCWLVQCLGATEVSFHSNKGLSVSQGMGSSMNVNAEVGVRKVSVGGGYSNSMKRDESYTSNQQVELVQHFSPKKQAYCPNDLIWLDSDPAWQMLLKQRLEGGILEYTYKISSSETCQISTSEMEEVKANFEYIMVKANGSYNSSTDNTFSRHEDTEWSLHVKFAPLEELAKQSSNHKTEALKFSDEEIEYFDMVKECLEDGEIGVRERKLLDKIRVKNGISEERAKELEATLSAPQLTDDEKEYLEAFKDACEDGKVSDKQRRLLEKLRVMYGISEERAREIEKH